MILSFLFSKVWLLLVDRVIPIDIESTLLANSIALGVSLIFATSIRTKPPVVEPMV